jgi:hypothetical protein
VGLAAPGAERRTEFTPVAAIAGVRLAALGGAITLATWPGSLPVLAVLGLGTIVAAIATIRPVVARRPRPRRGRSLPAAVELSPLR